MVSNHRGNAYTCLANSMDSNHSLVNFGVMWRNAPLHFCQNRKYETHEELNFSHFSIACGWGVPAWVLTRLSTHCLCLLLKSHINISEGETPPMVQNSMWWIVIVYLISFQALLILPRQVQTAPLVNAAAFFEACSRKISCTCYKDLTESMAQPTHFFQWFLALADLYPLHLHANVQTLSNMRRWCA